MLINRLDRRRGDTLIEVLFAVTVFSLVAVGAISIMNQGTATSERALEITLVRQEIDAQAESLRFLHSSYIAAYQSGASYQPATPAGQWSLMQAGIISSALTSAASTVEGTTCATPQLSSFIINTRQAKYVAAATIGKMLPAQTFSKVRYDGSTNVIAAEGIWIEAVRSAVDPVNPNMAGYIDFYIRACWAAAGQVAPATIGTIVRLYEPRG